MLASNASSGDLLLSLPLRTWATHNLLHGIRLVPREKALDLPYLALNSDFSTTWMTFDVDREGAAYAWEDAGIPVPTYTVINPANAHAHLIYKIDYVWHRDGDEHHSGPVNLVKLIRLSFTELLNADRLYVGKISKNPFHPAWKTISGPKYTMSELAEYLPQGTTRMGAEMARRKARAEQITNSMGRNCALFDAVRFEAYARVCEFTCQAEFACWVLSRSEIWNSDGLPVDEVRSTAKSIARFVWANKGRCHLGRRKCSPDQVRERQQQAADRTNVARRSGTAARIDQAQAELSRGGLKVTQAAIAKVAGVSIRTVQRLRKNTTYAPPSSDNYLPEVEVAGFGTEASSDIGFLQAPIRQMAAHRKRIHCVPWRAELAWPLVLLSVMVRPRLSRLRPGPPLPVKQLKSHEWISRPTLGETRFDGRLSGERHLDSPAATRLKPIPSVTSLRSCICLISSGTVSPGNRRRNCAKASPVSWSSTCEVPLSFLPCGFRASSRPPSFR